MFIYSDLLVKMNKMHAHIILAYFPDKTGIQETTSCTEVSTLSVAAPTLGRRIERKKFPPVHAVM